jgi:hypothetical protein
MPVLICLLFALLFWPVHETSRFAARVQSVRGRVWVVEGGRRWPLRAGHRLPFGCLLIAETQGGAALTLADGSPYEVFPGARVILSFHRWTFRRNPSPNRLRQPTAVIAVRAGLSPVDFLLRDEYALPHETHGGSLRGGNRGERRGPENRTGAAA